MSKYAITAGIQNTPVKTVLYGPEGIGKSSFAAQFPQPVFIDTEGGTKRLNVARLPAPTSWAMLLDEVEEVRKGNVACRTLVIDTADWAERLVHRGGLRQSKGQGHRGFWLRQRLHLLKGRVQPPAGCAGGSSEHRPPRGGDWPTLPSPSLNSPMQWATTTAGR